MGNILGKGARVLGGTIVPFYIIGVFISFKSLRYWVLSLRANLITVTPLDKWKAVFVNSFSAGAIHMY